MLYINILALCFITVSVNRYLAKRFFTQNSSDLSFSNFINKSSSCKITKVRAFFCRSYPFIFPQLQTNKFTQYLTFDSSVKLMQKYSCRRINNNVRLCVAYKIIFQQQSVKTAINCLLLLQHCSF